MVELAWFLSAPGSPPWQPHTYLSSFLSASLLGHDITSPLYTSPSLRDSATATHIYPKMLLLHEPASQLLSSTTLGHDCLSEHEQLLHVHDLRLRSATLLDLTKDPFISSVSLVYSQLQAHP